MTAKEFFSRYLPLGYPMEPREEPNLKQMKRDIADLTTAMMLIVNAVNDINNVVAGHSQGMATLEEELRIIKVRYGA